MSRERVRREEWERRKEKKQTKLLPRAGPSGLWVGHTSTAELTPAKERVRRFEETFHERQSQYGQPAMDNRSGPNS